MGFFGIFIGLLLLKNDKKTKMVKELNYSTHKLELRVISVNIKSYRSIVIYIFILITYSLFTYFFESADGIYLFFESADRIYLFFESADGIYLFFESADGIYLFF